MAPPLLLPPLLLSPLLLLLLGAALAPPPPPCFWCPGCIPCPARPSSGCGAPRGPRWRPSWAMRDSIYMYCYTNEVREPRARCCAAIICCLAAKKLVPASLWLALLHSVPAREQLSSSY